MGQRFYIDENDLDGQLQKLNNNLYEMLDFAYLHEDTLNDIYDFMFEWTKELDIFQNLQNKWDEMSNVDNYEDINDWLREDGTWWMNEFHNMSDDEKKKLIRRYRLTIQTCLLNSNNQKDLIEEAWEYEQLS